MAVSSTSLLIFFIKSSRYTISIFNFKRIYSLGNPDKYILTAILFTVNDTIRLNGKWKIKFNTFVKSYSCNKLFEKQKKGKLHGKKFNSTVKDIKDYENKTKL